MEFKTPLTHINAYELVNAIRQRSREIEELLNHLSASNRYWTRAGIRNPFWDPDMFEGLHDL